MSCVDDGCVLKEDAAGVEVEGSGVPAGAALVGSCTRERIEVRTGIVSRLAGDSASGRRDLPGAFDAKEDDLPVDVNEGVAML